MLRCEIRPGAYYDSVVLMQLQRALTALPGVQEAGVVMGTAANKDVLAQSNLLAPAAQAAGPDDLIIVVLGESADAATDALGKVDALLVRRRGEHAGDDYRPQSIDAAVKALPAARWMLVSVPGRYAAEVAREGVRHNKNVFLYSDNVSVADEVALKQSAAEKGLLVLGPDCGTAIVNGVGLGFANRVRRGAIGVVAASGTGLQQVTARIHQLGGGITHALGTGGRDLAESVGAITARQALDLLSRDPETVVIVLISKPPSETVAHALLQTARATGKPVIIDFIGYQPDAGMRTNGRDNLHFVRTLDAAAARAVELARTPAPQSEMPPFAAGQRYLRGLFSGGTLAYEALLLLQDFVPQVWSNAPLDKRHKLEKATVSQSHTIVDLGEDEFTVGRLHPMMDNDLRIKRLAQEADDPETAVLLLDVVLGDGAHPDPAAELAPAIADARARAAAAGRHLAVVAVVVGTDADPQGLDAQIAALTGAGAHVELDNEVAVTYVGRMLQRLNRPTDLPAAPLACLHEKITALNVGLESFTDSLTAQGATAIQVDWRPPAGGNPRLAGILARMKQA